MSTTLPVLFVSGAGLPPWIWDDVRRALPVDSRVADRPSSSEASLGAYADAALACAAEWDRFVVVAHSVGGVIAGELATRAPQRLSMVVGVAAVVPEAGHSFLASLPFPQRHLVSVIMRLAGTRPPAKEIRDRLCRGVAPEIAERIVAEFRPESQRLYRDRLSADPRPARGSYLLTQQDPEFSGAAQRRFAARLGGAVQELPTGHLPMLEQPALVAELLVALLTEVGTGP